MTRQTLTALISAVLFVGVAIALATVPVPFVVYSPGSAIDVLGDRDGKPVIELSSVQTFPTSGRLEMTTVSVTRSNAGVGVPEAMLAYLLPDRETLPRAVVYPEDPNPDVVRAEQAVQMDTSQDAALIAALRKAEQNQSVRDRTMITSVTPRGPAAMSGLQGGDLLLKIDNADVTNPGEVKRLIERKRVGDVVPFGVVRDGREFTFNVTLGAAVDDPKIPVAGIVVGPGYSVTPQVRYNVSDQIGGPSAGLIFALAIYDKITQGPLINDGTAIAGTGTIDASGQVGRIGGIREKIATAESAGATAFLVPADNCADVAGLPTRMSLVAVGSLDQAVQAVEALQDPARAVEVPRC